MVKVNDQLDALRAMPWGQVVAAPRKIRQSLDKMLEDMKSLPSKVRQYPAYEYRKEQIQTYEDSFSWWTHGTGSPRCSHLSLKLRWPRMHSVIAIGLR